MLDFEGSIFEPSRMSKNQVVFEKEDDAMTYLASTMASVSAIDWEANIDANAHAEFVVPPSIEQCSRPSSDVTFYNAIHLRG